MKKVGIVLTICVVIALAVFFMWNNPELGQEIGDKVTTFFDKLIEGKYVEYTKDFEINDLKISNSDYYFKKLTEDQKKIYTAVAIAVKDFEKMAKVKAYENNIDDIIISDASEAMEAFYADHPEAFYLNLEYEVYTVKSITGKSVEIKLKYLVEDKAQMQEQLNTVKSKVNNIISSIKGTTAVEKELEIHDYLAKNIEYYKYTDINSIPSENHTLYGALIKNKAVCDGISKAFQILCDKVGIENILVSGKIDELHAWNLVKLDDEWYNVDLTSDKSIKNTSNNVIHTYFNITTDSIKSTHTLKNEEKLPDASATKYNYYIYKDYVISQADIFDTKLQKIINESKNEDILEFSVAGSISDVPEKIISSLQKNKNTMYLSDNMTKVNYYSILNTYIIKKIK